MTPTTLRIDRNFRGVGRIARATGTTQPAMRRKLSRMLTALYDDGRLDILRAIRDGKLAMLHVYEAYQRKALAELPVAETMHALAPAFQAWLDTLAVGRDCSKQYMESMRTTRRYLERHDRTATVADLPKVLEALRDALGKAHPTSFNMVRIHAMSFVRATLKRSHPLWAACQAVERRKVGPKAPHNPLSVEQMRNIFPHPESVSLDAIAWGMATTGMGPKEYWGEWSVKGDRVHIVGTKRVGRVRDVPLVRPPAVPTVHRLTFIRHLKTRTNGTIKPYDFRRTFANWMEAAGVPRTRRKLYLGHGVTDVTALYELHEVAAFVVEDGNRMRAYLNILPHVKLRQSVGGAGPTNPHTIALVRDEVG